MYTSMYGCEQAPTPTPTPTPTPNLMYTSMYGCEQAPSWPVTEQWPCDKPEGLFAFGMFYWVTYKLSPNPNPNLTGGPLRLRYVP